MSEKKTCFFGFQPVDREAARLWLEEMERDGWRLEQVKGKNLPRAHFSPRTGGRITYWVDAPGHRAWLGKDFYLGAWSAQGWELVGETAQLFVFRSAPGQRPRPCAQERAPTPARRALYALLWLLAGLTLCALALRFVLPDLNLYRLLTTYKGLVLCLTLLLVPLSLLASAWGRLARLLRPQDGWDPTPAALGRARFRGSFLALMTVLFLAASVLSLGADLWSIGENTYISDLPQPPVLTWEDLGQSASEPLGVSEGTWLLTSMETRQYRPQGENSYELLLVARYDTAYPWVADLVYADLRREVPENRQGVAVLRYGGTVLRLEGPVDFERPEVQSILQANLAGR